MDRPNYSPEERGSIARTFGLLVVGLLVVGLCGVVLYLLSEINRGRYRLATSEDHLLVQQGAYLPMGFVAFDPGTEDLRQIYSPLPLPEGSIIETAEIYEDRADLDRALFAVLAGWSRRLIESPEVEDFDLALTYVERAELLPGLSEEQRVELRLLRADTAYRHGRRILETVGEQLKTALEAFELSIAMGTTHRAEAQAWIDELDHRIRTYRRGPPAVGGSLPKPMPTETIPPPEPEDAPNPEVPETPEEPDEEPPKWRL